MIDHPEGIDRVVDAVPGVVARAERLSFSGLISNGRGELPILGEGVEPAPEAKIGSAISMVAGRPLAPGDEFAIVVGEGLANALKLKIGDSVNLLLTTREGAMNTLDFTVVGVFRSLSKEYDARAVRVPLPSAQELTAVTGVNAVVVLLAETDLTAPALTTLQARLPAGFEVGPGRSWPTSTTTRQPFMSGSSACSRRSSW